MDTNTEHTAGPWEVVMTPGNSRPRVVASLYVVAECEPAGGGDHANARRIVACVNACEGIADPQEMRAAHLALPGVARNAAELLAQRDELLAALRSLDEMVQEWAEENGHSELVNAPEMLAARTAIAKAERAQ